MANFNNIPLLDNRIRIVKHSKIKDGIRIPSSEICQSGYDYSHLRKFYEKLVKNIVLDDNTITVTISVKNFSVFGGNIEVEWSHISPIIPTEDKEMIFDEDHWDKTFDIPSKYNGELSPFLHGLYVFLREYEKHTGLTIPIMGRIDMTTKVGRVSTKYIGYKPKLFDIKNIFTTTKGDMQMDRRSGRSNTIKKVVLSFNVPDVEHYEKYAIKDKLSH